MLDAGVLEGFVGSILSSKFDDAVKTPAFHREGWDMFTSKESKVALSAPRGHAKTTGMTVAYGLATLLFRERRFMLLVSDTESQATMFLGYFKEQLQENQALIDLFELDRDEKGIVRFDKDTETDIIVKFKDGSKFRVIAKGAEQKLRGLIWNGTRPDIILCHEEGTEIYTPETGWVLNTNHPTAQKKYSSEAYKITFDDGHTEVVSEDHRFLTESGWKYIWELSPGTIIQEDMKVLPNITIKQKLKNVLRIGMQRILMQLLLLDTSGISKTKKRIMRMPVGMLLRTLLGKLLIVPKDVQENSKPFLLGCPKNI